MKSNEAYREFSFDLLSNLDYPDLDYPDFSIIRIFLWSQFGYDYLLVTIKIRSHVLFKTTALKGAVKCNGFLLSKSKGSARACRKKGDIGIFGFAVLASF